MRIPRPRPSLRSWLWLPRRTARLRLTVLYGGVLLACGAAVLALTYLLDGHATPLVPLHQPPKGSGPPKFHPTLLPPPSRLGCGLSRRIFSRRSPPTGTSC
jgi:hypothetical protein